MVVCLPNPKRCPDKPAKLCYPVPALESGYSCQEGETYAANAQLLALQEAVEALQAAQAELLRSAPPIKPEA